MSARAVRLRGPRHAAHEYTVALGRAMLLGVVVAGSLASTGWLVSRAFGPVPRGYFVRALLASTAAWVVALPLMLELCRRGAQRQQGARTFLGRVAGGRSLLLAARLVAGVMLTVHGAVFSGAALAAFLTWGGTEATLLVLFGATVAPPSALAAGVATHRVAQRSLAGLGVLRSEDVADLSTQLPLELAGCSALAIAPLVPAAAMFARLSHTPWHPTLLVLALLVPAVAALFYDHGRRLTRDLERARGRVSRIQDRANVVAADREAAPAAETLEGARIHQSITALVSTHDRLCEEELSARSSIAEAQRLKTRFMAYMSHDLRSPLNAILGFSDMLDAGSDLNPEQSESLQIVRNAAADLLRLVAEVLDSARLEAGKLKLASAYVPPATLVSAAVGSARRAVDALGVHLDTSVEPGVPAVFVDAMRMQQALLGLVLHLAHISPRGGTIAIRVGRAAGPPGPAAQVRVFVDAPGMRSPTDPEDLFLPFRVGRRPSGTHVGGLGLGLSLARALLEAQGGAIWFEPPHTVCVALPREGH